MILKSEKLTSRSSSATLVADSSLIVAEGRFLGALRGVGDRRVEHRHVFLVGPACDLRLIEQAGRRHSVSRRRAASPPSGSAGSAVGLADAGGAWAAASGPTDGASRLMICEHRDAGLDARVHRGVLCSHARCPEVVAMTPCV